MAEGLNLFGPGYAKERSTKQLHEMSDEAVYSLFTEVWFDLLRRGKTGYAFKAVQQVMDEAARDSVGGTA